MSHPFIAPGFTVITAETPDLRGASVAVCDDFVVGALRADCERCCDASLLSLLWSAAVDSGACFTAAVAVVTRRANIASGTNNLEVHRGIGVILLFRRGVRGDESESAARRCSLGLMRNDLRWLPSPRRRG